MADNFWGKKVAFPLWFSVAALLKVHWFTFPFKIIWTPSSINQCCYSGLCCYAMKSSAHISGAAPGAPSADAGSPAWQILQQCCCWPWPAACRASSPQSSSDLLGLPGSPAISWQVKMAYFEVPRRGRFPLGPRFTAAAPTLQRVCLPWAWCLYRTLNIPPLTKLFDYCFSLWNGLLVFWYHQTEGEKKTL